MKSKVLDFIDGVNTDMNGGIQICTIVDYYCDKIESAKQMLDKMMAVINNNNEATENNAKYSYDYIEKEGKARFTLFGSPSFIIATLKLLEQ